MAGMVFGNGSSVRAGRSVAEYLQGYMGGKSVEKVKTEVISVEGPGDMLRGFWGRRVWHVVSPVFLWVAFGMVLEILTRDDDVVLWLEFMLEAEGSGTRLFNYGRALRASFRGTEWLIFFYMFEGEAAIFRPDGMPALVSGTLGVFVGCAVQSVSAFWSNVIIVSSVLIITWACGSRGVIIPRWFTLAALLLDWGRMALVVEGILLVVVANRLAGGDVEEQEVPEEELTAHRYLSIIYPEGKVSGGVGFSEMMGSSEAMAGEVRMMALAGDRFLSMLTVEYVERLGGTVADASRCELSLSNEILCRWTEKQGLLVGEGRKVRSAFPEFLWGEMFHLYRDGHVTFRAVYEAFIVFRGELMSSCAIGVSE